MSASPAPSSSSVYYSGKYWNNRPEVLEYLNLRATGSPSTQWWQHLLAWHGGPFDRILAFNCGNGWVERDLLHHGVARSAVGVDISDDLLAVAETEARQNNLDITYHRADTNTFPFQLDGIDCVVNYAAGHHVARLDGVVRRLADLLGPDGVFVSWDYTGPHRNQYPADQWEAMHRVNESLPPELRKQLTYPHLPTMLVTDPSEAVHSELILDILPRYFELRHLRHLGGPIAYELLNFNDGFFDPERDTSAEVHRILEADAAYTDADPARRSLFTYVIATPRADPPEPDLLAEWQREEHEREERAAASGGRYYPDTVIGRLTERIEVLERQVATSEGQPGVPSVPRSSKTRPARFARRVLGRGRRGLRSGIARVRALRG